ncbi:hypothetical protein GC176_12010 [bacterium]|nr:hypothetical protein [bacterium]
MKEIQHDLGTMNTCSECGFLGAIDTPTGNICEAKGLTRSNGRFVDSKGHKNHANVVCYKDSPAFVQPVLPQEEPYTAPSDKSSLPHPVIEAITRESDCDQWIKYRPGKSPQEHEMLELLLQQGREATAEKERTAAWREADVTSRETAEHKSQVRHEEMMAFNRSSRTLHLLVGFLLALLASLTTLVAAKLLPFFHGI